MFPKLHILVRPASLPSSPQGGRQRPSVYPVHYPLCTTLCLPTLPMGGRKEEATATHQHIVCLSLAASISCATNLHSAPQLSPCLHQDQNLGYAGRVREGPTTTAPAACKYLGCGHCLQAVPEEKGVPLNHQEGRGEGPGEG